MAPGFGTTEIFEETIEEKLIRLFKFGSIQKLRDCITQNSSIYLHFPTYKLQTPLTACIDRGDSQILSLLLEKMPTNLNETLTQACGRTILMYAAQNAKNTELLRILLDNGADLNETDMRGWSCLQYAIFGKKRNNIAFLLNFRMNVNMRDFKGRTPLMISVLDSDVEVMKLLLDRGADINACDEIGFTALHLAIMHKKRDAAILLMQRNADITKVLPLSKASVFELSGTTMPNLLPTS